MESSTLQSQVFKPDKLYLVGSKLNLLWVNAAASESVGNSNYFLAALNKAESSADTDRSIVELLDSILLEIEDRGTVEVIETSKGHNYFLILLKDRSTTHQLSPFVIRRIFDDEVVMLSNKASDFWRKATDEIFSAVYVDNRGSRVDELEGAYDSSVTYSKLKLADGTELSLEGHDIILFNPNNLEPELVLNYCCNNQAELGRDDYEFKYNQLSLEISKLGHDLKNPLGNIETLLHMAQEGENADEVIQLALESIQTLNLRLTQSLQSIRMLEGEAQVDSGVIDFNAVVSDTLKLFRVAIKQRQIIVYRNTRVEQNINVPARELITSIIQNLLDNAIKYSDMRKPIKKIDIFAQLFEKELLIHVKDNGVGMSQEFMTRMYEKYQRADKRNTTGYGIGLYLIKRELEHIGGSISVKSRLNVGSSFTVHYPLADS